ncbi:hypothetical protein AB0H49_20915 [Nocardia sp. NPDC050713]|uniref:hypothetical protein n=1 Tax=Nocardia sp. NPDC050713 TaxID=3154511 RepID=UPI0033DAACCB
MNTHITVIGGGYLEQLPDERGREAAGVGVVGDHAATAKNRTGALDLPGNTWRDRPAVDRGGDVYLTGDMVAAPGMRAEISINSALLAARGATAALRSGASVVAEP